MTATGPWTAPDPASLLHSLPDPVIVVDEAGVLTWANGRAETTFGIPLTSFRGRSITELIHPDDIVTVVSSVQSVPGKELGSAIEVRARVADGNWAHFEVRGWSGLHDHRVRGIVGVLRRLDDRDGWSVTGGDPRRRAALLDQAPMMTLLLDDFGRLHGASRAFTSILGLSLEQTVGRFLTDLVIEEDSAQVRRVWDSLLLEGGTRSLEATFRAGPDRRPTPFWLTAVNLLDDVEVRAVVLSGVDIGALVAARTELAHRATHDPLTGLANRSLFLDLLERSLRESVGTSARVGVVFCDIDGFKDVNDEHGHSIGDEVLREVARRLRGVLGPGDVPARLGGDELVALVIRDSVDEVEGVMEQIVTTAERPLRTERGPVALTLSAGCAVARHGARADLLLRRADQAMYEHKRSRVSRVS